MSLIKLFKNCPKIVRVEGRGERTVVQGQLQLHETHPVKAQDCHIKLQTL